MLLLPPGSAIVDRSTGLHSPASAQSLRPPTTHQPCWWSKVSVVCLSPVHFRGPQARQVSCYALFKGWLLLSLPSCCLCSKTPFCLTLSKHLGTLTLVWVRSEEHTSELQSLAYLVCRLLLEKKNTQVILILLL